MLELPSNFYNTSQLAKSAASKHLEIVASLMCRKPGSTHATYRSETKK